jgi:hypothetical protein
LTILDDLHAEMIVPILVPLEERDLNSLTLEEMRELLKRQEADLERQNLKRQLEENRRKLSGTDELKKEVKREHNTTSGESRDTSKRRRIETVDLTND